MNALIPLLTLLLVAAVVATVSAPLRTRRDAEGPLDRNGRRRAGRSPELEREQLERERLEREELEAAREAKYREIRDAELDYRTGKLSRADFEATDAQLRAEALRILDRLEAITPAPGDPLAPDPPPRAPRSEHPLERGAPHDIERGALPGMERGAPLDIERGAPPGEASDQAARAEERRGEPAVERRLP